MSRPPDQPFAGKAALVTGVSPGALGTALGNYHLRQVLSVLGVHRTPGLEMLVGAAVDKFEGTALVHEPTRQTFANALAALADLATTLRR